MTILKTFLSVVLLALVLPVSLADAKTGVGDHLPHSLETVDQNGTDQDFKSLKGANGAVLVFVRSADWCPFCQAQLIDLGEQASQITELGYSIVAISYDDTDKLDTFSKKYNLPFTMLSDQGSEIIKAFGILNEDMKPSSSYYGVPHPTIYIVNADGYVTDVLAEEGYKNRPPAQAIVSTIKSRT